MITTPIFLEWLKERLVQIYHESPNVDFVLRLQETIDEYERLLNIERAVRHHAEKSSHDRCWENDLELYRKVGLDVPHAFPCFQEAIAECIKYCSKHSRDGKNISKTEVIVTRDTFI